jgi:glutamate carboxypeptidase
LSDLLEWTRARQAEMTRLLAEIVDIESPSDDPAAVARLASRLSEPLRALGLDVEQVPVPGAGPILRARTPGGRRPVMLLGHLDTVWPMGTTARRPATVHDGVLRGPGAYDMKGGLVVALFALMALHALGRRVPVTVFFTPLEEVDCGPYRGVMEAEMKSCAAVLDFEPAWPGGAVKTERKGSGTFTIRCRGKAAHAGADFTKGASAVLELARRTLEAASWTDLGRGVTVNVGVVRGGIRPNVVADTAEAEIDVRVKTQDDARRIEAALARLRSETAGVSIEVEGRFSCPPLERSPRVIAVFREAQAAAAALGLPLEEVSTGGASEASFAAALGVPTLDGLGADGDGAHAEHEHVVLASLPERAALAASLIQRLASGPA